MINLIYNNIIKYIHAYGKHAILCGLAGALFYMLISPKQSIKKKKWNCFIVFCFVSYLYMVYALTILSRSESYISNVNWIPFATFRSSEWDRMFFYENILLFFPLPVFLYLLHPIFRKFWTGTMIGLFLSSLIEVLQYLFHCGWCDIDDILTNTVGAILGWLFIYGILHCDDEGTG